ncbi:MAG: tetratricopeptide repeat protein [Nanobdellota archaeon]
MKFKLFLSLIFIAIVVSSCATGSNNAKKASQAESLRDLGDAYLSSGNAALALRELMKAELLQPDDPYIQNSLGLAFLSRGRNAKAILHFRKAIELKPDYAPARNNLASAYIADKKWDKAIDVLLPLTQNILYTTPHFAETNIAYAYRMKKDYESALKHYKNSLDLAPDYIIPMRGLSIVYRHKGDYKKSLKMIEKAIKNSPRNAELYIQKGLTLEFSGETVLAEQAYLKAKQLGDDDIKERADELINNL